MPQSFFILSIRREEEALLFSPVSQSQTDGRDLDVADAESQAGEEARKSVVLTKDSEHENEYKNPKVRSDEFLGGVVTRN